MDRLSTSELTVNLNESTWDKISREIDLFTGGIAAVPAAAKSAAFEHTGSTICKGVVAAALSAGLTYATECRAPVRLCAQVIGVGLGVAALSDGGKQLLNVRNLAVDTWRSPINFQQNRISMQTKLAPLAVDTAISLGGSALGGYAGRALLGPPPETKLPQFTREGYLPPGVHPAGWQEFRSRFDFTPRRSELLGNMETLLQELRKEGGEHVYVGGSFVTTKPEPRDFDMTWRVSGDKVGELLKKSSILTNRALQKETLGGELMATYPNSPEDGIVGFLQLNRRINKPVGIVDMDLSSLPSRTSFLLRSTVRRLAEQYKHS